MRCLVASEMERAAAELFSAAETVPGVRPRRVAMVFSVTLTSCGGPKLFFGATRVLPWLAGVYSIRVRGSFITLECGGLTPLLRISHEEGCNRESRVKPPHAKRNDHGASQSACILGMTPSAECCPRPRPQPAHL